MDFKQFYLWFLAATYLTSLIAAPVGAVLSLLLFMALKHFDQLKERENGTEQK